jgi:hypothetical protein
MIRVLYRSRVVMGMAVAGLVLCCLGRLKLTDVPINWAVHVETWLPWLFHLLCTSLGLVNSMLPLHNPGSTHLLANHWHKIRIRLPTTCFQTRPGLPVVSTATITNASNSWSSSRSPASSNPRYVTSSPVLPFLNLQFLTPTTVLNHPPSSAFPSPPSEPCHSPTHPQQHLRPKWPAHLLDSYSASLRRIRPAATVLQPVPRPRLWGRLEVRLLVCSPNAATARTQAVLRLDVENQACDVS